MEKQITVKDVNGKTWIGTLKVDFNAGRGHYTEQEEEEFFSFVSDFVEENGVKFGENWEESIMFEVANESKMYKEMDSKLGAGSAEYFAENTAVRFTVERI